jgi:hypothetical protein
MTGADVVLDEMARELRSVLLMYKLDPTNQPEGKMPTGKAWREYIRRGGRTYESPGDFVAALVKRVGEPS